MRLLYSLVLLAFAFPIHAQPPCDWLDACFEWEVEGNTVSFINCTPNESGIEYVWQFGDGSLGEAVNPTHVYVPGTYTVCLLAAWEDCADDICYTITIGGGEPCDWLDACFEWEIEGNTVNFINCTPNENGIQYEWQFGDGSFGEAQNPSHTYEPGTYTVCLLATWEDCADDICYTITIGGGDPCDWLDACFEWEIEGNIASFINCTPNESGIQYSWNFGDGSFGEVQNPSHTYAPGTYTVCLLATWEDCADDICYTITIGGGEPCDWLDACFEWEVEGNTVSFINCTLNESGIEYSWNFGDGSFGEVQNPSHIYEPGTYTVCLLTTLDDCASDICHTFTIEGSDPCDWLDACFEWGIEGNTVNFINCTPNESGIEYSWNFGDGTFGEAQNPSHTYEPGTYTVCLLATWEDCADDICYTITIGGGEPCDWLDACFEWQIEGNTVNFINCTPNESGIEYSWNFGDGSFSEAQNLSHTYAPGTYTVCLLASWEDCADDICYTITIGGGGEPCEALNANFTYVAIEGGVQFVNTTTGAGFQTSLMWYLGGDITSEVDQPFQVFTGDDLVEVCLLVTTIYEVPGMGLVTCEEEHCVIIDPMSVGIAENDLDGVQIYPNPARDHVWIDGELHERIEMHLFGADGRLFRSEVIDSFPYLLQIEGLPAGVHMIDLRSDKINVQKRLVIE